MGLYVCPVCKQRKTIGVIDSREVGNGEACRRRYKCKCGARFTTFEVVHEINNTQGRPASGKGLSHGLGAIAVKRIIGGTFDPI